MVNTSTFYGFLSDGYVQRASFPHFMLRNPVFNSSWPPPVSSIWKMFQDERRRWHWWWRLQRWTGSTSVLSRINSTPLHKKEDNIIRIPGYNYFLPYFSFNQQCLSGRVVWFSNLSCTPLFKQFLVRSPLFIREFVTKWETFPRSLPENISTYLHTKKIFGTTCNVPTRQ